MKQPNVTSTAVHPSQQPSATKLAVGQVWLIGCGPGDPELLTLKAARAISSADVLIYDRLVDPDVLLHARPDALKIYVGKEGYGPSTPQSEINAKLLEYAQSGKRIARLKGGDAFVFARASEELATLQSANIPVTVIPGITAAHACAASAQLPLTQRQLIQQITLVTGTSADGELDVDWPALAKPGSASAIYMGLTRAPVLQRRLLVAGANPETTTVIVENGSRENERTISTRLKYLAEAVEKAGIDGPAIIFVGLDWTAAGLQTPIETEFYPVDVNMDTTQAAARAETKVAADNTCKNHTTHHKLRRQG
ncbi:MAG: uroporphyrinogen-III C-methyltransferase [Hyphomicrobiaceae bacterium]